jgi:hypothetical protein
MRLWAKDDADLWSIVSPEFNGAAGEGFYDEISGHVWTSTGAGITGVMVEAFSNSVSAAGFAYTTDDGNGSFTFTGLDLGVYRIQATWLVDGIASSVSKDGIPVGYADADFNLAVGYALASVSGQISGYRPHAAGQRLKAGRYGSKTADYSGVELYQQGRCVAAVDVENDGSFKIANLLPGYYEIRAPGLAPIAVRLKSGENLLLKPAALIADDSLYAYPNPARDKITFRLQTDGSPVKGEISVFNLAGRLVRQIGADDPGWAGSPHVFTWVFSGTDPAPGVYFYKVNVKSQASGETKVKTGKFAVIR